MDFQNLNQCFSSTLQMPTISAAPLSAYACTEVYMYNHGTADCFIFTPDGLYTLGNMANSVTLSGIKTLMQGGLYFKLRTLSETTIRGVTNSNQVSALAGAGTSGQLSFRAQFFSSNPLNTY